MRDLSADQSTEIASVKSDLRAEIVGVKLEVLLLKWMVGLGATTLAFQILLLKH